MKRFLFCLLLSFLTGLLVTERSRAKEQLSDDEAAIRANAETYLEAFNKRDANTLASLWSEDAVYMDPDSGEGIVGREAIAELFKEQFANSPDLALELEIHAIEFLSPNVAIENGTATVRDAEEEPSPTHYSAVHVKRDGQWLIDRVSEEESPEPPPSNYEQLKSLEWMIGSWVEGDEDSSIVLDCQWTKNNNFISRSFAVVVRDQINLSGVQIIGWDPAAKQIRSWVFDSHGGFAEGTWSQDGDHWMIHSNGILPTGEKSSSVNIVVPVDENSFTWQSVNRQVAGQLLPNVEEVLIVRDQSGDELSAE